MRRVDKDQPRERVPFGEMRPMWYMNARKKGMWSRATSVTSVAIATPILPHHQSSPRATTHNSAKATGTDARER